MLKANKKKPKPQFCPCVPLTHIRINAIQISFQIVTTVGASLPTPPRQQHRYWHFLELLLLFAAWPSHRRRSLTLSTAGGGQGADGCPSSRPSTLKMHLAWGIWEADAAACSGAGSQRQLSPEETPESHLGAAFSGLRWWERVPRVLGEVWLVPQPGRPLPCRRLRWLLTLAAVQRCCTASAQQHGKTLKKKRGGCPSSLFHTQHYC